MHREPLERIVGPRHIDGLSPPFAHLESWHWHNHYLHGGVCKRPSLPRYIANPHEGCIVRKNHCIAEEILRRLTPTSWDCKLPVETSGWSYGAQQVHESQERVQPVCISGQGRPSILWHCIYPKSRFATRALPSHCGRWATIANFPKWVPTEENTSSQRCDDRTSLYNGTLLRWCTHGWQ